MYIFDSFASLDNPSSFFLFFRFLLLFTSFYTFSLPLSTYILFPIFYFLLSDFFHFLDFLFDFFAHFDNPSSFFLFSRFLRLLFTSFYTFSLALSTYILFPIFYFLLSDFFDFLGFLFDFLAHLDNPSSFFLFSVFLLLFFISFILSL
jgi:hypothetical protein